MTERKGMDVHEKTWFAISREKKRVTSERDEVLSRTDWSSRNCSGPSSGSCSRFSTESLMSHSSGCAP